MPPPLSHPSIGVPYHIRELPGSLAALTPPSSPGVNLEAIAAPLLRGALPGWPALHAGTHQGVCGGGGAGGQVRRHDCMRGSGSSNLRRGACLNLETDPTVTLFRV